MTRILTPLLTFIGGLYFFLEFILPETLSIPGTEKEFVFGAYLQEITRGVVLISAMAVGLGVINLCMLHGKIILRKSKGMTVSFFLLASFFITFIILCNSWHQNEQRQSSWNSTLALTNYTKDKLAEENISKEKLSELKEKLKKNIIILKNQSAIPLGTEKNKFQQFLNKVLVNLDKTEFEKSLNEEETEEINKLTIETLESKNLEGEASSSLKLDAEINNEKTSNKIDSEIILLKEQITEAITELSIFRTASLLEASKINQLSLTKKAESIIIHGLFFPLGLSMFSLLAFYIAYAAYRSFKIRSIESGIMMFAAFIVILGQIPQGIMYISSDLPAIRLWLMQYLSTPAMRAIYFSSAIAGLSIAVRMWLSIDKNPISSK